MRKWISAPFLVSAIVLAPGAGSAVQSAIWLDDSSGLWTDAERWSTAPYFPTNGSPTLSDRYDVTIDATGSLYTITLSTDIALESFHLNSSNATVSHRSGILDINGTATLSSGTFLLDGGTLRGGTWELAGGALAIGTSSVNTLDGVLVNGDLDLSRSFADLHLRNGANFTGTANIGSGAFLWADDDLQLDGNTINLTGSGSSSRGISVASGATLTLGSTTRVDLAASESNLRGAGEIVNEGTIHGESRFSVLTIAPGRFVNRGLVEAVSSLNFRIGLFSDDVWTNEASGTIQASGDSRIAFYGQGFNQGTIRAINGAELFVGGAWNNDGLVDLASSRLWLDANLSTEDLGTISSSGDSLVTISGILDNTGHALSLGASGPRYRLDGGSLVGGVVEASSRPLEFAPEFTTTTHNRLDGVLVHEPDRHAQPG